MSLALEVHPDASSAARRLASLIAERAHDAVGTRGRFALALSRAAELVALLRAEDVPWPQTTVYQADERVAPRGHEDRNLEQLLSALPNEAVRPMPVDEADLEEAAARYGEELPARLDLVHLGLGPDGHTASLIPGDPVLQVRDRPLAVTGEYQGRRRMTLTYPALDAAREIAWLVTGEQKREMLARLLARDESIPAARISNPNQLVVVDAAAAP